MTKDFDKLPVLVLPIHEESLYAEQSLLEYIMKQEAMESVVNAVRKVLCGRIYVSEKIKENIIYNFANFLHIKNKSLLKKLTERELEVFRLIGQGLITREIAVQLSLSIKTIGTNRERIKEKLNLKN